MRRHDLVDRLRYKNHQFVDRGNGDVGDHFDEDCEEAANEITRLRRGIPVGWKAMPHTPTEAMLKIIDTETWEKLLKAAPFMPPGPREYNQIIVFLDMDGVLASPRAGIASMNEPMRMDVDTMMIDPIAVGLFNRLCRDHNPQVVISSTWRNNDELRAFLRGVGVFCDFHPDWRTPEIRSKNGFVNMHRGTEIKAWLDAHPKVQDYLILDDDLDILPEQEPFWVRTDTDEGFLYKHWNLADKLLQKWHP